MLLRVSTAQTQTRTPGTWIGSIIQVAAKCRPTRPAEKTKPKFVEKFKKNKEKGQVWEMRRDNDGDV